jgi:hypothetical protein
MLDLKIMNKTVKIPPLQNKNQNPHSNLPKVKLAL